MPSPEVRFHPGIMSGEPCIMGTRIPTYVIADYVWQAGVAAAMDDYDLDRHTVLVACWFVGATGIYTIHVSQGPGRYKKQMTNRLWIDRWRDWALEAAGPLWSGKPEAVTDPPGNRA